MVRTLVAVFTFLYVVAGLVTVVDAQTAEKRRDLIALMEAAGLFSQLDQMSRVLWEQQKSFLEPSIRESLREEGATPEQIKNALPIIVAEMDAEFQDFPAILINRLIPEWDALLTHNEVRQLRSFYESPLGRKLVRITPQLMKRGMEIGSQLGGEVGLRAGQKAMKRIRQLTSQ